MLLQTLDHLLFRLILKFRCRSRNVLAEYLGYASTYPTVATNVSLLDPQGLANVSQLTTAVIGSGLLMLQGSRNTCLTSLRIPPKTAVL